MKPLIHTLAQMVCISIAVAGLLVVLHAIADGVIAKRQMEHRHLRPVASSRGVS